MPVSRSAASPTHLALALAALILAVPQAATAQGTPGVEPNKCLAGKTKCVSKKIAGLMKCRELCQKKPDKKCGPIQAECEQKVVEKFEGGANPAKGCFAKLESKEDPAKPSSLCTTTQDTAAVEAEVDAVVATLLARLEGSPPPVCGDGVINVVGEQCDGADFGGQDCASLGFGNGLLACDGTCGLDTSGCAGHCSNFAEPGSPGPNCLTELAGSAPPGSILAGEPLDDVIRVPVICYDESEGPLFLDLWDDDLIPDNGPVLGAIGTFPKLWDETGLEWSFAGPPPIANPQVCHVIVYHDIAGGYHGQYPWGGGFALTPSCREALLRGCFTP